MIRIDRRLLLQEEYLARLSRVIDYIDRNMEITPKQAGAGLEFGEY